MAHNNRAVTRTIKVLIVGNPNSGKSSIFNSLTGSYQQVSNYPGVTVERKIGIRLIQNIRFEFEDLPGMYSLTPYTEEERIARDELLNSKADLVIDVVDSFNLERNLYLTIQLMELGKPFILVLNMSDIAERRGIHIDTTKLSKIFNVPVVKTVGNKGEGIDKLLTACISYVEENEHTPPRKVTYGHEVDNELEELTEYLSGVLPTTELHKVRWYAIKVLERDEEILKKLLSICDPNFHLEIQNRIEQSIQTIEQHEKEEISIVIAQRRYGFVAGAIRECVYYTGEARQNITDQIDNIVCNRYIGPFLLIFVIGGLFYVVFKLTQEWRWIPLLNSWVSPIETVEIGFVSLARMFDFLEVRMPYLHSLITEGIIGGVGAVLSFVPMIFVLFFLLSALEDTGYVARIAFILDRLLRFFGLQGRSILALLIAGGIGAGGCAVPGILATRTLQEKRDKIITMLVVPFMSCGAKLPVYALLIAVFFRNYRTIMMLILWAISWMIALISAFILSKILFRGEQTPFVLELPPYHVPVLSSVIRHAWGKTWLYIRKAGTLILAVNIVMWALIYIPLPIERPQDMSNMTKEIQIERSIAGIIGKGIEPLTTPIGFDWKINIALIGGIAAKEVIVGTLGIIYAMEDHNGDKTSLPEHLAQEEGWHPLKALTLMIFVMIYAPCIATLITMGRESRSIRLPLFSLLFSTLVAYIASFIVFQLGHLLSLGT